MGMLAVFLGVILGECALMPFGETECVILIKMVASIGALVAGLGFFRAVPYLLRLFAIWRAEDHYSSIL